MVTTKRRTSLDEFLRLEETQPYLELIDREVVQKSRPTRSHSRLVIRLGAMLTNYLDETLEGTADTELRHAFREDEWVFLPDIAVALDEHVTNVPAADDGPIETMPDFAIEVLSPDDTFSRVARKIDHYLRSGVALLWVIDPKAEEVTIYEQGKRTRVAGNSETIDARPVLRAFEVDLAALFGRLHQRL